MNTLGIALVLGLLCLWTVVAEAGEAKKLNPYTGQVDAIQEGKALYDRYGCADCHRTERGARGGGQGLAVLDDEWVFGSDDETLFKLIRGELPGQTMPATPGKDLPEEEIWKMLAYIRSLYQGDPSKITW
jgi:mono/diheme cytochrome c family protein